MHNGKHNKHPLSRPLHLLENLQKGWLLVGLKPGNWLNYTIDLKFKLQLLTEENLRQIIVYCCLRIFLHSLLANRKQFMLPVPLLELY